ncbi:MAG: glycosyltransferase 36, partial [Nitrobacter vulgaris]|nr:glycosyltransferase 36 [Nitrobacter vulgaris]
AFAKLGEGACAVDLFSLINPINHARTFEEVKRYKVEPYVVAADVYSVSPHTGRGGWTWYTGSAAWMYRAGVESILGIRREGAFLVVAPCIPSAWPGFEAAVKVASTHYDIRVRNLPGAGRNVVEAILDGAPVGRTEGVVRVPLDGKKHVLAIHLGSRQS